MKDTRPESYARSSFMLKCYISKYLDEDLTKPWLTAKEYPYHLDAKTLN